MSVVVNKITIPNLQSPWTNLVVPYPEEAVHIQLRPNRFLGALFEAPQRPMARPSAAMRYRLSKGGIFLPTLPLLFVYPRHA